PTLDVGLPAQLAFGTDLAGHPGDLAGEGVELVDHDVDGVLELEDLAPDIDRDLSGEVAAGHGRDDFGDVADLGGQAGGQLVDVVGHVLPGAGGSRDIGLTAQPPIGADLAGHARDLAGEVVQLVHHGVDRVLELQDLAPDVNRDLLGQVAAGYRGRDFGDVAHLAGEVAGHQVNVVGEIFPGARHADHVGLAAQLALGPHLARHPGHLGGEGVELVDHGVDGVLQLQDLAAYVDRDLTRQD